MCETDTRFIYEPKENGILSSFSVTQIWFSSSLVMKWSPLGYTRLHMIYFPWFLYTFSNMYGEGMFICSLTVNINTSEPHWQSHECFAQVHFCHIYNVCTFIGQLSGFLPAGLYLRKMGQNQGRTTRIKVFHFQCRRKISTLQSWHK